MIMQWKTQPWLCIDTETTGLEAGTDRIVELAGLTYRDGEMIHGFHSLLNPGRPIPPEVSAIHGITDEMVAGEPPLAEVATIFLRIVERASVLVAYNWPFDAGMLAAELGEKWSQAIASKPIIDPLVVVRFDTVGRFWKGKGRHKLGAVAKRLKVPFDGDAHRTWSDAITTGRVLTALARHLPDDAEDAAQLIRAERKRQDDGFKAWQARQPKR